MFTTKNGSTQLSLFSRTNGIIHYYDLNSGDRIRALQLEISNGPNGIGRNLNQIMHLDISKDSIVINAWNQTMMTINDEGKVLKNISTVNQISSTKKVLAITISKDNRPFYRDGKVYVNCEYRPDEDYASKKVILLDLKTGDFNTLLNAPKKVIRNFAEATVFIERVLSYYVEPRDEFVVSFESIPMFIQYLDKMERLRNSIWDQSISKTLNPTPTIVKRLLPNKALMKKTKRISLLGPKFHKIIHLKESGFYLRETFLSRK